MATNLDSITADLQLMRSREKNKFSAVSDAVVLATEQLPARAEVLRDLVEALDLDMTTTTGQDDLGRVIADFGSRLTVALTFKQLFLCMREPRTEYNVERVKEYAKDYARERARFSSLTKSRTSGGYAATVTTVLM